MYDQKFQQQNNLSTYFEHLSEIRRSVCELNEQEPEDETPDGQYTVKFIEKDDNINNRKQQS